MKNKIMTLILFIIMLFLIGVICLFMFAIYIDMTSEDIIETMHSSNNTLVAVEEGEEVKTNNKGITGGLAQIFTPAEKKETVTYSPQSSSGNFYYEQLNDNQKIIYNGLQENKENMISGTYVIQFGEKFSDLLSSEDGTKTLKADYQAAVEAYTHDNPELFYIDIGKLYLNIEKTKNAWSTTYNVYISPEEGKTYYNDNFTNETQIRVAINQIESIRDNILSKLTDDTYKNIKIIHDYLVDNVEYDKDYESIGTYSIYGALIDRKCVCDGYARTFKYLANAAGIECELIQGTATNSSGITESHAWNSVYLENRWYYVDVTWDDPIIIGDGYTPSSYHYRYFLKGSKTFEEDHVLDGKFSDGGKVFSYPSVSYTDY